MQCMQYVAFIERFFLTFDNSTVQLFSQSTRNYAKENPMNLIQAVFSYNINSFRSHYFYGKHDFSLYISLCHFLSKPILTMNKGKTLYYACSLMLVCIQLINEYDLEQDSFSVNPIFCHLCKDSQFSSFTKENINVPYLRPLFE